MGNSNDAEADAFSGGDRKRDRKFDDGMNRIDADRLTHLHFLQNMERVDRAIRQADDLEQMLKDTLDVVLDIFDVDRAFLFYPCDPDAESFSVPMESTRPEYPGAREMGFEFASISSLQSLSRDLLDIKAPMSIGSGSEKPIPAVQASRFSIKSVLCMPIFPKVGSPWITGMQQCSRERKWTDDERQLFQEIGRRIADSLSSFLAFRELQQSEARYRTLVENIPGAVYQCDIHNGWEIRFISGQIERITGYPPSHFVGRSMQNYYDLIHPDDLAMVKRGLDERIRLNKPIYLEYRIRDAAGAERWVFSRGQVVYDERGKACRLDGVINDNTERKVAEESLRASEEKYRSLFEWSADPMFLFDGDMTIDCNEAAVRMYGYRDRDSLINKHPWDLSPDFQPDGKSSREKALEIISELPEKRSIRFEWLHKSESGDLFPVEIVLTLIKVGDKQIAHAVSRDLSELKLAEEAVRESEEKYRALFEQSADSILLLADDTFVDCNDAAVRMYGYQSKNELVNLHPWEVSPEFQPDGSPSREKAKELIENAFQQPSIRFEWWQYHVDGELFPAEVVLTYIKIGDKAFGHAVVRDITELKRTENALLDSERKYRALFECSDDPTLLIDVDTFVDCNDAAVRMLRYESKEELLQMHPWELSPEFQANGCSSREKAEEILAAMPRDRSRRFEWTHRRADGELFPAEVLLTYIPFGEKHLINTVWRDLTELKQAEKALQESEEKYRSLFEGSADATLLVYGDTFVDCNDAAVRILRCGSKDEILQRHPWDFAPEYQPDGRSSLEVVEEVVARMPQERSLRFEWYHRRADGELFPADVLLTYIAVGDKTLIHTVWRDITVLKETEAALQQSEEKYRALFEWSADATTLLDGDTFVDCNEAAVRMFGFQNKEEILGLKPGDVSPEFQPDGTPSPEKAHEIITKAIQDRSFRFEWTHRRANGESFPTEIVITFIKVGEKNLCHGNLRDISALKKAEEEARHLRNLLKNIVNSMPSVLIGVDADANIIQWNLMAQQASGISPEEAQGKNLLEVFPEYAGHLARIRQSIEDREVITAPKIPVIIEGQTRFSDITIYPLITNGIDGAVIRIDDVTERVQVEEMIVQSEKMLSVGGLAAGMAHEINNPLAGILQSVQVILDRFSPDMPSNQKAAGEYGISLKALNDYLLSRNITDLLRGVHDSGRRAARIVDNMLSFSRKSSAEFARKNLAEIIDRTLELTASDYVAKRDFQFREIQIERDYAADLPDVPCEETEIQQVILNLFKNAAHAMVDRDEPHPPPCLTIRTSRDADMAKIEIQDNGPGMSEGVRRRVFEPFYTTKSVGVGTGLGLSVSYFIITETHQGTLSVESTLGKGTKFIIQLPMERRTLK